MSRVPGLWMRALALALVFACASANGALTIAKSKHDLSVSGTGIKALTEARICIFCHTPHNAAPSGPLWNRKASSATITPYASSTNVSSPGQPTGGSILCLSCHDGTIALGDVLSLATRITMAGSVTTMPTSSASKLGTDLSGDHPFSFAYTPALVTARGGELANPSTLATGPVRLDSTGQLQCTSCHDPHDNSYGKFLVMSNQRSALCNACHIKKYWSSASHNTSTKTWNKVGTTPWTHTSYSTVQDNGCEGCHRPHTAPFKKWLLNNPSTNVPPTEEGNCYPCHNATVATYNIQTEFNKASIHPVASTAGVHDPIEFDPVQTPSAVVPGGKRHVECVDCHNPHGSNTTVVGTLPGSLNGVRGVDAGGASINVALYEYQICYRCHGDSSGQPAPKTTRWTAQTNTRLDFLTTNKSCHPVAGACPTVSPASVLVSGWTATSTMKCGDCHNNNSGTNNGGAGPKGPHGSTNPSLLERANTGTRPALCAKCHTTTYVKFNGSNSHLKHTGDIGATCNTCHDPHGTANTPSMINFDKSQVTVFKTFTPSTPGQANNGSCSLTCHGQNHNNCSYTNC